MPQPNPLSIIQVWVMVNRTGWREATLNLLAVSCTYPLMVVVAVVDIDATTTMISTVFLKSLLLVRPWLCNPAMEATTTITLLAHACAAFSAWHLGAGCVTNPTAGHGDSWDIRADKDMSTHERVAKSIDKDDQSTEFRPSDLMFSNAIVNATPHLTRHT